MIKRWINSMRAVRCVALWVVGMIMCTSAKAEWVPLIRNFSPETYHASTQNWKVIEEENGWIYAANNYGILEWDGTRWSLFGIGNGTAVRAIASDKKGKIYAGGTDEVGFFTANRKGGLDYHSLMDSIGEAYRQFGEVWQIIASEEQTLIETRNHIFILNEKGCTQVLSPSDIIKSSIVRKEALYIATAKDIYVVAGHRLHPIRGTEKLRGATVCAMWPWGENEILIGTDTEGLFRYDGNEIAPLRTEADRYIKENQLYTIAISDEYVALGTVRKGIAIVDKKGKGAMYIAKEQGMQNNTVLSLCFDKKGNLWAGLDQGIDCIELAKPIAQLNNRIVDFGAGYSACEGNGMWFFGTNQGVYFLPKNGAQTMHPTLLEGTMGQVWEVKVVGKTLYCSQNKGLFTADIDRLDEGAKAMYTEDGVWSIRERKDGSIVAGTYNGFVLIKGGEARLLRGFHETALYYETDERGNIWILTTRGVEKLTISEDEKQIKSEVVYPLATAYRQLSICKWGQSVVVTGDSVCAVIDSKGEWQETEAKKIGLPRQDRYLALLRNKDGKVAYITEKEMPDYTIGGFANAYMDEEGNVIVGGTKGFYRFGKDFCTKKANALDIRWAERGSEEKDSTWLYLRAVKTTSPKQETIMGESFHKGGAAEGGEGMDIEKEEALGNKQEPIRLEAATYSMNIQWAIKGGVQSQNIVYATRLWPVEKEFGTWSEQSERDITALGAGEYRLDIKAIRPGSESEEEVSNTRSVYITIARNWWARWWAIMGYVIAIIGIGGYVAYVTIEKNKESKRRLVEENNRKVREQEVKILQLENEKAQFAIRQKSQELSTMLLSDSSRKELTNEVLVELRRSVDALNTGKTEIAKARLMGLQNRLSNNADATIDWQRFEENYDMVNDQFLQKLKQMHAGLSQQERRLAVYIRMGLRTKEIAPLMNLSEKGVDMMRYRMREKMGIEKNTNLKQYLNSLHEGGEEE